MVIFIPIIHLDFSVPSSFDWGSVVGGIIGALGAFFAAYIVYLVQRAPTIRRMRHELKLSAGRIIHQANHDIRTNMKYHLQALINNAQSQGSNFMNLVPIAAEFDQKFHKKLLKLINDINESTFQYGKSDSPVYIDSEADLENAKELGETLLTILDKFQLSL